MAAKERLTATVDAEVAAEVRRLAQGMEMSVAQLLGILISIAVRSTGDTFLTLGANLQALTGGDAEDETS